LKAILIRQLADKQQSVSVEELDSSELGEGDVTVRVSYSTLNYKDALAITGKGPVVRKFPMVPGIDFAGVVVSSDSPSFKTGDEVLANGWGMGETSWGGLAQLVRVPGSYLLKMPAGLSAREAMSIGTAGYTAMLCVFALEDNGVLPGSGEILVTGANGGVGSYATSLLSARGFNVCASTGRPEHEARLKKLGAASIIPREQLASPGRPLGKERWSGVIDSVGSHTLANACGSTRYGGVVAACGMAQGLDFPGSVAPFILRAVKLVGVDSVYAPTALRQRAWQALAKVPAQVHEQIGTEVDLSGVIETCHQLLAGQVTGRVLVNVNT